MNENDHRGIITHHSPPLYTMTAEESGYKHGATCKICNSVSPPCNVHQNYFTQIADAQMVSQLYLLFAGNKYNRNDENL